MVRGASKLEIAFSSEAYSLRNAALDAAKPVQQVTSPEENELAVQAQTKLNDLVKLVEKDRKAAKAPFLKYMDTLDDAAKDFVAVARDELVRVSLLVGDFAALELAKTKAAEAARNQSLTELERERAEALAEATTHESLDEINEHFNRRVADLPPMPAPNRADGQIVKSDWSIEVTDIWMLVKVHPGCVKVEPRLSVIKELLNLGVDVKGVRAVKVVSATVKTSKEQKAIEA